MLECIDTLFAWHRLVSPTCHIQLCLTYWAPSVYYVTVQNFGNPEAEVSMEWLLYVSRIMTGIVEGLVQVRSWTSSESLCVLQRSVSVVELLCVPNTYPLPEMAPCHTTMGGLRGHCDHADGDCGNSVGRSSLSVSEAYLACDLYASRLGARRLHQHSSVMLLSAHPKDRLFRVRIPKTINYECPWLKRQYFSTDHVVNRIFIWTLRECFA